MYHEREKWKLVSSINRGTKPVWAKGKLFIFSQRRFSANKCRKWECILGKGSILCRLWLMSVLWLRPQYNRVEIFNRKSYRHCKGESGKECGMETSWCIDLEKVRGEEGIKCEQKEENKEENTLGALRCEFEWHSWWLPVLFQLWWENVSLQKQAKCWDCDRDVFCWICTDDRSRCCKEITTENIRNTEI